MDRELYWGRILYSVVIVVFVLGYLGFIFIPKLPNAITDDIALSHFRQLAQTQNVVIVTRTNDSLLGGDTHDVSYELLVSEKPKSGNCKSGTFSPIVCRIYNPGQG